MGEARHENWTNFGLECAPFIGRFRGLRRRGRLVPIVTAGQDGGAGITRRHSGHPSSYIGKGEGRSKFQFVLIAASRSVRSSPFWLASQSNHDDGLSGLHIPAFFNTFRFQQTLQKQDCPTKRTLWISFEEF